MLYLKCKASVVDNIKVYLAYSFIVILLLMIVSCKKKNAISDFYGTWENSSGLINEGESYEPYTLLISKDYLHFVDSDGDGFHRANPEWEWDENFEDDTKAEFPEGFYLFGDVTFQYYEMAAMGSSFISINNDGQLLLITQDLDDAPQIIFNKTSNKIAQTPAPFTEFFAGANPDDEPISASSSVASRQPTDQTARWAEVRVTYVFRNNDNDYRNSIGLHRTVNVLAHNQRHAEDLATSEVEGLFSVVERATFVRWLTQEESAQIQRQR